MLEIDDDSAFDYEVCKTFKYTKLDYLNMIMKEAKDSHQLRLRFLKKFYDEREQKK